MGILLDENTAQGVSSRSGKGAKTYQVGVTPVDGLGLSPEVGLTIPWTINPKYTFLEYKAWLECYADSGIVVHRPLPQGPYPFDHLGNSDLYLASGLDRVKGTGPNIASGGNWTSIVQRMADTQYWFCLKGFTYRVGYQPVFPYLVSIVGQQAVPDDSIPQKTVGPIVVGNNSGVPVYYAAWAFWYTIAKSPGSAKTIVPPPNYAERTNTNPATPPDGIQIPLTMTGQESVKSGGPTTPIPAPRIGPGVRR